MLQIRYTYMWRRKMKVPSRIIEWLIFHRVNSKSSSELEIIEWTHLVPSRIIEWLIFRNTNSYCFFRVRMNFLVKRIQISRFNCNSHPFHKERAKREGANHNNIWKLQKKASTNFGIYSIFKWFAMQFSCFVVIVTYVL